MGLHAAPRHHRPRSLLLPLGLMLCAVLLGVPRADGAPVSADACRTASTTMPRGDCGPFWQVVAENFNGDSVPLGSFSDCDHDAETSGAYCAGLTGSYRDNWWAYPTGWPDTATDRGRDVGGVYHPEDTVSVGPDASGDGVMRIRMFRPADGGPVHSAAVLPRAVMDMAYGKFSARIRVVKPATGYKSAWLHYGDGCETDFPEGNWDDGFAAFQHPCGGGDQDYFPGADDWTQWHTVSTEWTPGQVRFFVDGKQIGSDTRGVADQPLSWVLQNESALEGPGAAPGSSAELDITWVAAYAYGWK
ncbi:glycoside hydrolase family 16 protein [Streptomyces mangrovisoli]|uniref:Glycosyl hydrolase family 16 n=1 Tax=Streptomyces mangrovisoli TaxID=1428628 RepID=A0A1J4P1P6_9ACTN|nr:glycoside hydrolase family 16 protein [Streptomyces mangrovisoli]OIJ67366.1 glycosyl hydrolase family 16 [Streptomyces mangrovisoli]